LNNLPIALNKHEESVTHIQSLRIDLALNEQQRLHISMHNAKVKENREILKDLATSCILLTFHGSNEIASSSNRPKGSYVKLLHAFAEKKEQLATHLETPPCLLFAQGLRWNFQ
jgi:hypothetical protein